MCQRSEEALARLQTQFLCPSARLSQHGGEEAKVGFLFGYAGGGEGGEEGEVAGVGVRLFCVFFFGQRCISFRCVQGDIFPTISQSWGSHSSPSCE